jgi:signal transduction histidine kinase/DNA-binding response OmpR family regulator/HPt (histidine-containing phosphotransfer) domain-containing protein
MIVGLRGFSDGGFMALLNIPSALKRALPLAAVFVLAFMVIFSGTAHAQITETARIELTDTQDVIPFGQQIYITEDQDRRLTSDIILTRHQNNLRGPRPDSSLINLGSSPAPVWMVFSVTNNSSRENWILHFGSVFDGRIGNIKSLLVENQSTGQTFIKAIGEEEFNKAALRGPAIPIRIAKGQTQQMLVFVEMNSSLGNTLRPALISYDSYMNSLAYGSLYSNIFMLVLLVLTGFFLALALLEKAIAYVYFSSFYIATLALYVALSQAFLVTPPELSAIINVLCILPVVTGLLLVREFFKLKTADETPNTLIFMTIGLIVVCLIFSFFLSRNLGATDELLTYICAIIGLGVCTGLAIIQAQQGKHGGIYIAAAWLLGMIGMICLFAGSFKILGAGIIVLNVYWLMLLPQSVLFIIGAKKKIDLDNEESLSLMARESRTAQSLARLKQSKETADQARLLRVIERERELMAELREREMQRTEEMRKAKEMADEANRAKSAFLAVVSHEIRTPMNGIMGMLRLLMDSKMTRQQNEYVQAVQKSGDTMMALLNDILDFEKIESGNMDIEHIDFDMIKLVQGVVTLMSGHVAEKGIKLRADISHDFPVSLKGDPTRLRQVLLNLVSNAIKFTSSGSVTIHLKSKPVDKRAGVKADYEIYCAVEDTGIGISEDAQKTLFNPFTQAEKSTSRKYGGTGLGLAICRRLIEAMGSTIQVNSQEGVGSTFFFTLWLEVGTAEVSDTTFVPQYYDDDEKIPSLDVLVIDDNELNRQVLKGFLDKDGHTSVLCESAELGLEICAQQRFDVIITDVRLLGMDGMEFTQKLRESKDPAIAGTPVVALTGNVSQEDQALYREAGMDGFLAKPLDPLSLQAILRDVANNTLGKFADKFDTPPPAPKEETPRPSVKPEPVEYAEEEIAVVDTALKPRSPAVTQIVLSDAVLSQATSIVLEDDEDENVEGDTEDDDSFALEGLSDEPYEAAPSIMQFSQALNLDMLSGLAEALPREQLLQLLKSFTDKADEIIAAMQDEQDANALRDRAHELKGMSANFGFTELSNLSGAIENAAKNSKADSAASIIPQLAGANARAQKELMAWIASLK